VLRIGRDHRPDAAANRRRSFLPPRSGSGPAADQHPAGASRPPSSSSLEPAAAGVRPRTPIRALPCARVAIERAMKTTSFLALAAFAASAATAQPAPARQDAMDSQARVPTIEYHSAFESYRSYRDSPLADWRKSNDEVRAVGGHTGHLTKPGVTSSPVGKPEPKASTPAEKPKPGAHGEHHR
jgi:hypothetical protein